VYSIQIGTSVGADRLAVAVWKKSDAAVGTLNAAFRESVKG